MRYRIKKKSGFTLPELIVVLLILALLCAIAIPSYGGYVERAREAVAAYAQDTTETALGEGYPELFPELARARAERERNARLAAYGGPLLLDYALPEIEGFHLTETYEDETHAAATYNIDNSGLMTLYTLCETIQFTVWKTERRSLPQWADMTREPVEINGDPGVMQVGRMMGFFDFSTVIFGDPDTGLLVEVTGTNVPPELIRTLAEGVWYAGGAAK